MNNTDNKNNEENTSDGVKKETENKYRQIDNLVRNLEAIKKARNERFKVK